MTIECPTHSERRMWRVQWMSQGSMQSGENILEFDAPKKWADLSVLFVNIFVIYMCAGMLLLYINFFYHFPDLKKH